METLIAEQRNGILWATLHRPEVLNAMNAQMEDDILEVLEIAASDPEVRVVVFRGSGSCFSAGHDVKDMGQMKRSLQSAMLLNVDDGIASQRAALELARGTEDYAEARAAVRERREPRFTGR